MTLHSQPAALNYLIFSLHGSRYAVDAHVVREVLWLPELTPIAEAPMYIIGVFNFRGKIVPIMDLAMRLGHPPQRYRLTDHVITLEQEGLLLGIVVNEVHDVRSISPEAIEAAPSYGREGETRLRFIPSVGKVEEEIILILNLENLLRAEELEELKANEVTPLPFIERPFCVEATPEEKAILHERARGCMQPIASHDFTGLIPLAVIGLSSEYFGVHLEVVREFADIQKVTPVPCCPEHIIGNMNLRGDIVTLVDIRGALKMPIIGAGSAVKVMVVHIDNLLVGVPIDEVFDVVYLRPADITPVPAALQPESKEYLQGTAPYGEKMLSILDLPKILTKEDLVVNEEV